MKSYYLAFCFLAFQMSSSILYSQNIGINSTGALPDSSAVLDVNSTTSGLLAPRMTTTQMNAIVRPATGLLVYNTTLSTFQTNTGTSTVPVWVTLITSTKTRNNYVLVKTVADLPAAVSGVRTLLSTTLYEINGTIVITDKIDLNGATLIGRDNINDILVYTPTSGELFTGNKGGNLKNLKLAATGVGSKLFNLNANGANLNIIVRDCFIGNCNNIGLIKGFSGTVYFNSVAYQNNTNGITFENISNLILNNMLWDNDNHNIYEKLVGTFEVIQILGGARLTASANTAVGLDITTLTSILSGSIKSSVYSGSGTYVNGTFSINWEVDTDGLTTEKDATAAGNLYITSSAATAIATVNVPMKAAGTTTAYSLVRFTAPVSNRLTYIGNKTRSFSVILTMAYVTEANNKTYTVSIYKNGVKVTSSQMSFYRGSSTQTEISGTNCVVSLSTNDYIEVWIENNTDNKNITFQSMNLIIR